MNPGLVVTVRALQASYAIGEAEWVEVRFENPGAVAYHTSHTSPTVEAVNADGQRALDPGRRTWWDDLPLTLAPGDAATLLVDVARYAWIDQPGRWHVALDLPLDGGPVRVAIDLVATEPTDLAAVVAGHLFTVGPEVVDRFDGLGHAAYVPILAQRPDERAILGLAACPCAEATAALLRICPELSDPRLRRMAGDELLVRIPSESPATWFGQRAWDPGLAPDARALAFGLVSSPLAWDRQWAWTVLGRVGDRSDLAYLAASLGSALRDGEDVDPLVEALRKTDLVPPDPDAALLLALARWDGTSAPAPAVLRAVTSPNPTLVRYGLAKAPPSRAVLREVVALLPSNEAEIAVAVTAFVAAHPDPAFQEPILAAFATTGDPWGSAAIADRAESAGIPLVLVVERARAALGPGRPNDALYRVLLRALTGAGTCGTAEVTDAELPALTAAWTRFLSTHRDLPVPLERTTDPALAPAGLRCLLADGSRWP